MDLPFASSQLDELMDRAGLDVLVVTTKHNVRYLLGGYYCDFFQHMDAVGVSRYLPAVVYPRGRPQDAHYIAWAGEVHDLGAQPIWVPSVDPSSFSSMDTARLVIERLQALGLSSARIGVELGFLPADAYLELAAVAGGRLFDAHRVLEELRAAKTPTELGHVRTCSEGIVESMLAVFAGSSPGTTKNDIVRRLRQEYVDRSLTYEYCLVSMGSSLNRARSEQAWRPGEVVCLDSGGQYAGYVGDVARMAVMGPVDDQLNDLLGQVRAVQDAARAGLAAGVVAASIFDQARESLRRQDDAALMSFTAHGMGLISHEAPRMTKTGPIRYTAPHEHRPLQSGMVLSIETWLEHPSRGFIKLEDTIAVRDDGIEAYGDHGRDWIVVD